MSNTPVIDNLTRVLSGTFVLAIRTQGAHWNVTGPHFGQLHALFEEQYTEMFAAGDEIAERMRALGHEAPGGAADMLAHTDLDGDSSRGSGSEMIADLSAGHDQLLEDIRRGIDLSGQAGDEGTQDMLIGRLQAHDKMNWMLKAHLG